MSAEGSYCGSSGLNWTQTLNSPHLKWRKLLNNPNTGCSTWPKPKPYIMESTASTYSCLAHYYAVTMISMASIDMIRPCRWNVLPDLLICCKHPLHPPAVGSSPLRVQPTFFCCKAIDCAQLLFTWSQVRSLPRMDAGEIPGLLPTSGNANKLHAWHTITNTYGVVAVTSQHKHIWDKTHDSPQFPSGAALTNIMKTFPV